MTTVHFFLAVLNINNIFTNKEVDKIQTNKTKITIKPVMIKPLMIFKKFLRYLPCILFTLLYVNNTTFFLRLFSV